MKKKTNKLIKTYCEFTEATYAPYEDAQRTKVCFCNIILSLYITLIVMLHNFANAVPRFRITVVCGLLLFCIVYQMFKLLIIKRGSWYISRNAERTRLSWKIFAVSSIIIFSVYIINLLAHYPGGISPDNISQWKQTISGQFNNWHPAIHTMIIWLVTRIISTYSFFVAVQILCFSVLSGYMAATLVAWGIKKRWLIAFLITVISTRSTRGILLYAWKDTALTICLLCLAVYMINIVLSDGKWLYKWHNVGAVAVVSALASIVRHNGFFFTIPLGILAIVFYRKTTRNVVFAVAVSFLVVLGITKVIYPLAKVEYPPTQTYVESVGVPMTIMGGVMIRNPESLDPQTKEFLNKIADDETWRSTFTSGSYNSIKFVSSASSVIAETPPKEFLLMTLRTIRNAPKESLLEVIALTRMVWDPLDWDHDIAVSIRDKAKDTVFSETEIETMQPIKDRSQKLYNDYIRATIELLTPSRILTSIGMYMLFILLAGFYSVNCNLGTRALFLFIPSIAYNFGTMLLLCGPDYRFFHFNTVITLPLIIALLAKSRDEADKQPKTPPTNSWLASNPEL